MTALSFRLATGDDVNRVVALVESAYRGDSSRQGWTTEADLLDGQRADAAMLSQSLARPRSHVVLAETDGQLLACAHIEEEQPGVCHFGMFSVQPAQQGGGIGRAMLAECERRARDDMGSTVMEMTVISQRRELLDWYERRGFRDTGHRRPFPYGDARFGLPRRADLEFVVMAKSL